MLLAVLALAAPAPCLSAQSGFARAEELFMQNNPEAALPALEAVLAEDPANLKAYQYLAIVYLQLERPDDAVSVYLRALPRGGSETAALAFNLGNTWFGMGNMEQAIRSYTTAIEANSAFAPAWLNRANARIKSGALKDAVSDYQFYLTLENHSPRRAEIERLLAVINAEFAAAERFRVAEEERVRAEEARRRQLLEEVSASLQADAGETRGMSAGTESLHGYEGEFELE